MKTKPTEVTLEQARRVLEVVDAGLCYGKGVPEPGKMCIEAAVTFALGEEFSDEPSCVAPSVRAFKIALNDSNWSSNEERAHGMRKLAIAQLGTKNQMNEVAFVRELAFQTIKQIVPISLRCAAYVCSSAEHKAALENAAVGCESALDLSAAVYAVSAAKSAEYAVSAESAAVSAESAAEYAESAAESAAEYAAESAVSAAVYAVSAAKSAEYAAEYNKPNYFLKLLAEIGVQALRVAGAAGIKWMDKIC